MNPLVPGLDVAIAIRAEQVLERAEIDQRRILGHVERAAAGIAGDVLPAIEIDMVLEVRLPRILNGGLEGDDQHALGIQLLRQLVAGEGLAETHLGVPEEARHGLGVLGPAGLVVVVGDFHRLGLLAPHREGFVPGRLEA